MLGITFQKLLDLIKYDIIRHLRHMSWADKPHLRSCRPPCMSSGSAREGVCVCVCEEGVFRGYN